MDLQKKGVLSNTPDIYNPHHAYQRVFHFTPHEKDITLQSFFDPLDIKLIGYRSPKHKRVFRVLVALFSVWRIFGEEGVQLVRGRLPYLGSLIGLVAARLRNIPFVVSLGGDNRIVQHRNGNYYYNSKIISYSIEWLVLRFSNKIIVPNQFTKQYVSSIIGEKLSEKKSILIPWISKQINMKEEDSSSNFNFPAGYEIIPIIGFLNKYKYTDVLYDTLENFVTTEKWSSKVLFCFCGDGPLKEEGENRFFDRSDIRFLGWQSHTKISELIIKAKCVLVPMSGLVLLETASAGKPVITSNIEWHQELVTDGLTGLVVSPESPEQWYTAIDQYMREPKKASEMGERLKERYLNNYTPEYSMRLEKELYQQLIFGQE